MATIQKLVVDLTANSQGMVKELTKGRKNLNKFAQDAAAAGKKIGLALAGTGAALATGALVIIEQQSAKLDALAKKADKLDMGTTALQRLEYQSELTGVSANTLGTAMQRMTRRVSEAAQGTGEAKAAIAELGLDAQKLAQLSPDQQFYRIAEAMKQVEEGGDRVRLAMKIFDSEGVGLVNTMAADLDNLGKEYDSLGVAITRAQAAQVEAYNDAKTKMATITDGFKNQITVAVTPALQVLVDKTTEWIQEMGGVQPMAQNVATWMLTSIQKMVEGLQTLLNMINEVRKGYNTIVGTGQEAGSIIAGGIKSAADFVGLDGVAEKAGMWEAAFDAAASDTAAARAQMVQDAQKHSERMQALIDSVAEARQKVIDGFNATGNGNGADQGNSEDIARWRAQIEQLQQQMMNAPGQNVAPILSEIATLRDKIANASAPVVDSNTKNTAAINTNTAALLQLAGGKNVTAAATATAERVSTTEGRNQSGVWDQFIDRFRTIAGSSQQTEQGAQTFAQYAQSLISRFEAQGGYDTDTMRSQMQEILQRMGGDMGDVVRQAMQGTGSTLGSITINLVKDGKTTSSGTVTGETDFLKQLADELQSAATAV